MLHTGGSIEIEVQDCIEPLVMSALVEAEAAECDDVQGMLEVLMQAVTDRARVQRITISVTLHDNVMTFERITIH